MIFVGAIEAFDYSGGEKNKRNALFPAILADSMCQMLTTENILSDKLAPRMG